jgi:arylsulfatase A-like enzyme/Flp pilus assembly protein TadD
MRRHRVAFIICGAIVFAPLLLANPPQTKPGNPSSPNIIFITVDTLRADHLRCYGDDQVRTPNIDSLAADGIRFTTVITPVPLTLPSHCSIMTGTYPMFHGVRDNVGYRLDPSVETLAQILKGYGYVTGAFVGAYVLDRSFGLGTGFDFYYDHFESKTDPGGIINMAQQLKRPGKEVVNQALSWISRVSGHPYFVWVHFYDAHDPYAPPPPFKSEYAARPYDGEIAYVDQQVGRLVAFLKEKGLYGKTLVVLTSDHGESLGEHREIRHGYFVYDATLLVPLIIKPFQHSTKARTVTQQVRSIDIAPTILEMLGFSKGRMMQGVSLVDLMLGKQRATAPDAYSESYYPRQFGWSALRSLRVRNLKYIDAPHPELYELAQDPGELRNRAADRPALVDELKARLRALEQSSSATESLMTASRPLSPEEMEKLASLGYVGRLESAKDSSPAAASLADPKDKIDIFYLINQAGVEAGNGHCDRAIETISRAIDKDATVEASYLMLGRCYFNEERYEEAEKAFDTLLSRDPNSTEARFFIAACQFNLDQVDSAEKGFEQVLKVNPRNTYAHRFMGFIDQAKGRPDLAIAEFEKVLETSPENIEAHGKLGFLLASSSRLQEALPHLQKVVAAAPSDGSTHYNLGLAYQGLGRQAEASREFSRACGLDKQFCGK